MYKTLIPGLGAAISIPPLLHPLLSPARLPRRPPWLHLRPRQMALLLQHPEENTIPINATSGKASGTAGSSTTKSER